MGFLARSLAPLDWGSVTSSRRLDRGKSLANQRVNPTEKDKNDGKTQMPQFPLFLFPKLEYSSENIIV